jgi:hypothetical protein
MKTMKTIELHSLTDFLGHQPVQCEICHHREAAVFMVAREISHAAKAHVCLRCFELVESTGFASIVESVSMEELDEFDTHETLSASTHELSTI